MSFQRFKKTKQTTKKPQNTKNSSVPQETYPLFQFVWECSYAGGYAFPLPAFAERQEAALLTEGLAPRHSRSLAQDKSLPVPGTSKTTTTPQPRGCPACAPALPCSPWVYHTWTCLGCSTVQTPDTLRDLEGFVLPKKPGDSTTAPSKEFTLLKFLVFAIILSYSSLSCITVGCLVGF